MKHGANIYKYAKQLSCKSKEIIDFSSNINSYHPNISITPTSNMLVKYGDSSYNKLKKIIATEFLMFIIMSLCNRINCGFQDY